MFSDKNNLINENRCFIITDITNHGSYHTVILTTHNIINYIDTNILIECVEHKLIQKKYPTIFLFSKTSIFFYEFPVHDIIKIDNTLDLEFWIHIDEQNIKNILESLNNVYNWSITVFYSQYKNGRNIYATDLIHDVFK